MPKPGRPKFPGLLLRRVKGTTEEGVKVLPFFSLVFKTTITTHTQLALSALKREAAGSWAGLQCGSLCPEDWWGCRET